MLLECTESARRCDVLFGQLTHKCTGENDTSWLQLYRFSLLKPFRGAKAPDAPRCEAKCHGHAVMLILLTLHVHCTQLTRLVPPPSWKGIVRRVRKIRTKEPRDNFNRDTKWQRPEPGTQMMYATDLVMQHASVVISGKNLRTLCHFQLPGNFHTCVAFSGKSARSTVHKMHQFLWTVRTTRCAPWWGRVGRDSVSRLPSPSSPNWTSSSCSSPWCPRSEMKLPTDSPPSQTWSKYKNNQHQWNNFCTKRRIQSARWHGANHCSKARCR